MKRCWRPDLLTAIAAACRDLRRLRLSYPGRGGATTRNLEPHRLVHTSRRWYLLAWDTGRNGWRTFRVDRFQGRPGPPGARFTPRPPPSDDVAAYVSDSISSAPYRYQARILMHASLEAVAQRSSPAAGRLEAVDQATCILHTGSNSLDELALYVAVKGFDFEVLHPPELIPVLRGLSDRLRDAADASTTGLDSSAGLRDGDPEPVFAAGPAIENAAVGEDDPARGLVVHGAGQQDPLQAEAPALVQAGREHPGGVPLPPPRGDNVVPDVAAHLSQFGRELVADD